MNPDDVERGKLLVHEANELEIKLINLRGFLNKEAFFKLDREQQYLLADQVYPMEQYLQILRKRIAVMNGWYSEANSNNTVTGTGARI